MTLPRIALLVIGIGALFWTPTLFITDELAQAAALHALAEGDFLVPYELGPGYDELRSIGTAHAWHPSLPKTPSDQPASPTGSTMLNVLALPVLVALRGLATPFGGSVALGLVASSLVATGAWAGFRLAGRRARGWPILAGFACLGPSLMFQPPEVAGLFLDAAALQLVSLLATGIACAYLFDLLRGFLPHRNALPVALLGALGTPIFFWASNAKYHALSVALLALCLWCIRDGRDSKPLHVALAYAMAGLAFWNQPPLGFVLGAAVTVALAPALWAGRLRVGLAAGLSVLAGLALWAWESQLLEASGGAARFVSHRMDDVGGLFSMAVWNDPAGVLRSAFANLFWSSQTPTIAILCMAPFLVLAIRGWRRAPGAIAIFAAAYAGLLFLLAGARLLDVGYSFDMRHTLTLWPILLLLAAPALSDFLDRRRARLGKTLGWMVAGWAATVFVLLAAAHHVGGFLWTDTRDGDLVVVNAYAGLALSVALLLAMWRVRKDSGALPVQDALVAISIAGSLFLQGLLKLHLQFDSGWPSHAPYSVAWIDGLSRLLGAAIWRIG